MNQHIGFDVSLKDTSISARQDGKRVWRGKYASDPKRSGISDHGEPLRGSAIRYRSKLAGHRHG
jgi:hypothetical protein